MPARWQIDTGGAIAARIAAATEARGRPSGQDEAPAPSTGSPAEPVAGRMSSNSSMPRRWQHRTPARRSLALRRTATVCSSPASTSPRQRRCGSCQSVRSSADPPGSTKSCPAVRREYGAPCRKRSWRSSGWERRRATSRPTSAAKAWSSSVRLANPSSSARCPGSRHCCCRCWRAAELVAHQQHRRALGEQQGRQEVEALAPRSALMAGSSVGPSAP